MNISYSLIDGYLASISNFFMIVLFPGFAFYNTAVAYGLIMPVFGGFFGFFSMIYLFFMLPVILRGEIFLNKKTIVYLFFYLFLCLYVFMVAIVNYALDSRVEIYQAYVQVIETLVLMFVMFLMGFFINLNKRMYQVSLFLFFLAAALLLFYVLVTGQVMFYAKSFTADGVSEYVSTYQGYARSATVISLILLSFTREFNKYLIVYLVAIFVLFILGSRSELSGLIFAGGMLVFFKFNLNLFRVSQGCFFLILGAVCVYLGYESFSENRNFQLLDFSEASSWVARENLAEIAFSHIKENPIFGYFAGHVIDGGSVGSYIHNMLSAWAGFGFFALILYLILSFAPLLDLLFLILKNNKRSDKFYFCFSFSAMVALLLIFSKSFFWFMPGLVWGMYLSVKRELN